ncbi:hypothetical protein LCGC14_2074520, partial [marine sediment metagenome]
MFRRVGKLHDRSLPSPMAGSPAAHHAAGTQPVQRCDRSGARIAVSVDEGAMNAKCHDCEQPYGDPGFPDLIIPNDAWRHISPTGDQHGILCPSCI